MLLVALLLAFPACNATPQLLAKAKVSCAAARATALRKLEGGRVKSAELEEECGKLVWSFDVKKRGKSGVDEVQGDARDGSIVSVKHETAREEGKEKD